MGKMLKPFLKWRQIYIFKEQYVLNGLLFWKTSHTKDSGKKLHNFNILFRYISASGFLITLDTKIT